MPRSVEKIRLAVISFAHAHVRMYCQVITDFDDAEVVACWDDDSERGQKQAAEFGLDWLPDLDQLLARDDIDAVFRHQPDQQTRRARHRRRRSGEACPAAKNRWRSRSKIAMPSSMSSSAQM